MKRVLVHICCGPCAIYPIKEALGDDHEVTGFFYNPNIHPEEEYLKRRDSVKKLAALLDVKVIFEASYTPEQYFDRIGDGRGGAPEPSVRCLACYELRLEETASKAKAGGFDCFTSALLYSKYQGHDEIRAAGEKFASEYGIEFLYDDYRRGWGRGIKLSKKAGLYRQQWCGCKFSFDERQTKTAEG